MTQFAPRTHRAREALLQAGRSIPGIWSDYDAVRREDGDRPAHLYLSEEAGAEAFVRALARTGGRAAVQRLHDSGPLEAARLISPYNTLAAWRMTQGIYRVDPALYESLVTTDLDGDIPADVLMRLPEWCVYIETPGLSVVDRQGEIHDLAGAWVRLDREPSGQDDLIIMLDIPDAPLHETHAVPLTGGLESAIAAVLAEWGEHSAPVAAISAYLRPIINVALFLCAGDDIGGRHGQPGNPQPVRTRRDGWRLFPADSLRTWDVGVRIGAALRRAYQAAETGGDAVGDRQPTRGHIRRAHWHGFRSGPRKTPDGAEIPATQRRFDLRWLPPIPVNLLDVEQLPAVIRPVNPS